jgi:glycosyltransferase involved in cell wall biosynthesis
MSKPFLLFRGPVQTRSGYGAHSRDLLQALYKMNLYDIKIDSCAWGSTPMTALEKDNIFHKWIESNIITTLSTQPDVYVQVTVPNEFQRVGKINIGITAGIETTVAPKSWVDGCNKMDMIIATSQFSSDVLMSTVYNETDNVTGKLIKQHKIEKPIKVLFEGVHTDIFNNVYNGINLDIKEDFAYLFVGHWLKGNIGQDRKDVAMLIKCFVEAFKNEDEKPALVLKTSAATFSIKQREDFAKKIKDLVKGIENPPSVYLLFGELTDKEMNELYNHPKIKAMISLTKGEGFGRPLLEFTMTGKPVIASNWSGHKDFLPMDKGIMIGGKLTEVDESAVDDFILKGSKWFTANYNEAAEVMRIVKKEYDNFLDRSEKLRVENSTKFGFEKMIEEFEKLLPKTILDDEAPKQKPINLPKLNKIK